MHLCPSLVAVLSRRLMPPALSLALIVGLSSGCTPEELEPEQITGIDNLPGGNPLVHQPAMYPFPSDFYLEDDPTTVTGRRVALDDLAMPEGLLAETYADADGFSRASTILTYFPDSIDPATLPTIDDPSASLQDESSVWLLREESWERVPLLVETDLTPQNSAVAALIIRPQVTLEPNTGYVVVLRDSLRSSDGTSTPPVTDAFRALRDGITTDNDAVEAQRDDFVLVNAAIAGADLAPEEVLLAWSFHTRSEEQLIAPLVALHDHAAAWPLGQWQIDSDAWDEDGEQRLIYGEYEVPDYLGEESLVMLDEAGAPVVHGTRMAPFLLTIPVTAADRTRPVVVFGHGFFSAIEEPTWSAERRALRTWEMPFATTEFIGFNEADQFETFAILAGDLNRADEIAAQQMQSHANHTLLVRLIKEQLADAVTNDGGVPLLDGSDVPYLGVSNGGTQGFVIMAASPVFERGALVAPGGSWTHMLQRATPWLTMGALLEQQYADPRDLLLGFSMIQLDLDPIDAVNWMPRLAHDRLPGRPEVKVVLHEAVGDCQVSNMITEWMARSGDIPLIVPSARDVWGLEQISADPPDGTDSNAALFIYDEGYEPLTECNLPPDTDNGAHETVIEIESYIAQIGAFLEDGTIVQVCDGACDPN